MNVSKVAIIDNHEIFRKGLIISLYDQKNIKFVFESDNTIELFEYLKIETPEVLFIEIELLNENGIDVCKKVKSLYPEIKVISISSLEEEIYIESMFEAGASAYLLKSLSVNELYSALIEVTKTGYYINQIIPDKVRAFIYSRLNPTLNPGEIEVLRLILKELTTSEIAKRMNLSPKTIENYRTNMLVKTGSRNVAGLITFAIKSGYIHL